VDVWGFEGKAVVGILSPKKCAKNLWPLGYVSRDSAGAGIKIGKKNSKTLGESSTNNNAPT
jgi:hypothetical protein